MAAQIVRFFARNPTKLKNKIEICVNDGKRDRRTASVFLFLGEFKWSTIHIQNNTQIYFMAKK